MANLTLLKMHNNWTGWGEAIMFSQSFTYFPFIYLESQYAMFPDVYHFMQESVSSGSAWLGAFYALSSIVTIDPLLKTIWSLIRGSNCCKKKEGRRREFASEVNVSVSVESRK